MFYYCNTFYGRHYNFHNGLIKLSCIWYRDSRVEDLVIAGGLVVPVELVEAASEGSQHEEEDEEELGHVDQHASQRDLQRAQVLVRLQRHRNHFFVSINKQRS